MGQRSGLCHLDDGRNPAVALQLLVVTLREVLMPQRIDDARHWRARAEEARDMAEQLASAEAKRIMLGIAVSYVALAQIADERGKARRSD
jgi:hypothetical protein